MKRKMRNLLAVILAAALCLTLFAGMTVMADETEKAVIVKDGVVQDIYDYLWDIPEDATEEEYIKLMTRNFRIIQAFELLFTDESYTNYKNLYNKQYKRFKTLEDAQLVVEGQNDLVQHTSIADGAWFLWGIHEEDNANGYAWFTGNVGPVVDGEEAELTEEALDASDIDGYGQAPVLIKCLLDDPTQAKGNLILISGGGFTGRSNAGEGYAAIPVFQEMGYNCFLLQRRVAPFSPTDIFMDLQRSVRLVRYYAQQEGWGGQDMIAAAGFSGGGGTIMGTVENAFGDRTPVDLGATSYIPDEIDQINSDMDEVNVLYGAGSDNIPPFVPNSEILNNPNLPAFYIAHGLADDTVPWENAQNLYDVCIENGIPAQLYLIPDAKHGFGPGTASNTAEGCKEWPAQADAFMMEHLGYSQK